MGKKNDIYLKGAIEEFFPELLYFFLPNADQIFDMKRGFVFMDKEAPELFPESQTKAGTGVMDLLVKVWLADGEETWILLHIEIQHQVRQEFAARMFRYYYRVLDRFNRPITAIAILTGSRPSKKQGKFTSRLLWTQITYEYKSYHIFEQSEEELLAMKNIFALVVLAAQKVLTAEKMKRNKKDKEPIYTKELAEQRLAIAKAFNTLAKGKYTPEQIANFFVFLQGYIFIDDKNNTGINTNFNHQIDLITGKTDTMGILEIVVAQAKEEATKKERRRSRIEIAKSKTEIAKSKAEAEISKAEVEKTKSKFVTYLLQQPGNSVSQIAKIASVTESFVEKIKKEINKTKIQE